MGLKKAFNCDALHELIPFTQFKKRKNHPWRTNTYPATLLKVSLFLEHFSRFLNCANSTKSR